MSNRISEVNLAVDSQIHDLLVNEILPGLNLNADQVWQAMATLLTEFQPRNRQLLAKREELQSQIDNWHENNPGADVAAYKSMLQEIGYLVTAPAQVQATTANVDQEITTIAGPQLVVPVNNARYALNAANARWGSLYDALYGTDALPGSAQGKGYDAKRGAQVIAYGKQFLDQHFPLMHGCHGQVTGYSTANGSLIATLQNGHATMMVTPKLFAGYCGDPNAPSAILLRHNNLHVELILDATTAVGQQDMAGITDIILESAISTIMDCEDSVAAVDATDKCLVYRNWLGLMKGDLSVDMNKQGKTVTRTMNADREYHNRHGERFSLHGRALLFVRNVGHLMTNDAILNAQGEEIPEGIMDALFTTLCSMHDLNGNANGISNSRQGSVYIVKPKMHGPEEVTFTVDLFTRIEALLGLPTNTLKIGIMDEERRTSINLKACIAAASERVAFINTGFLDRTGDEIHTSMNAGPMVAKGDMKQQAWINTYEDNNVKVGLECGLQGRAQIGKGMWAKPDCMAEMMEVKVGHPMAGANTAWVPSPTGATLHAMHYHDVLVQERQEELKKSLSVDQDKLLEIPLLPAGTELTGEQITRELDNNCQGILGYVIRWVEGGVGCSKVPDINQVGLMEDRATLRISAQALANWLAHGICTRQMVVASMQRMARLVDKQNAKDPTYRNMAPNFDSSVGYQAALELVFEGKVQPSGYTEPVLHRRRKEAKQACV
ncbi:MAG: malate synthase G [Gammaproteobacteria bacterium]|nr:malate synthase G [Gammaproteobacteria bacterium]MCP4881888.1 malate synthase G [Gammaproteobacteria bacterium]